MNNQLSHTHKPVIGVVLRDLFSKYEQTLTENLLQIGEQLGYTCTIYPLADPRGNINSEHSEIIFEHLLWASSPDALFISMGTLSDIISEEKLISLITKLNVPAVSFSAPIADYPCITFDNYEGVCDMVTHLVESGNHTKFACIRGPQKHEESLERYRAVVDTLNKYNLTLHPDLVAEVDLRGMRGAEAVSSFLKSNIPFDCLICPNDDLAIWAMQELQNNGYHIPNDVAIVGVDDTTIASATSPKLTTIRQPIPDMVKAAIQAIDNIRNGQEVPSLISVKPKIILRESCGGKERTIEEKNIISDEIYTQNSTLSFLHLGHFVISNIAEEEKLIVALLDTLEEHGLLANLFYHSFKTNETNDHLSTSILYESINGRRISFFAQPQAIDIVKFPPYWFQEQFKLDSSWYIYPILKSDHEGRIIYLNIDLSYLHLYESLRLRLCSALQKFQMVDTINAHNADLESLVDERTDELESALQAKNELLNILSHKLRNPLSSVMMTIDILDPKKFDTTPETREIYRERALESTKQILQILDQLLEDKNPVN